MLVADGQVGQPPNDAQENQRRTGDGGIGVGTVDAARIGKTRRKRGRPSTEQILHFHPHTYE